MNAFCLQDIGESIRLTFDIDTQYGDASSDCFISAPDVVLVAEKGKTIGYVLGTDLEFDSDTFLQESDREQYPEVFGPQSTLRAYWQPFKEGQVLPAETPLFDALPLLPRLQGPTFLVGALGAIVGAISEGYLQSTPFRVCLFALLSQLEIDLRDMVVVRSTYDEHHIQEAIQHIPKKIISRFTAERGRPPGVGATPFRARAGDLHILLGMLSFRDLVSVVLTAEAVAAGLPFPSPREAREFFDLCRATRNQVVHNQTVQVLSSVPRLLDYLSDLLHVTRELEAQVWSKVDENEAPFDPDSV